MPMRLAESDPCPVCLVLNAPGDDDIVCLSYKGSRVVMEKVLVRLVSIGLLGTACILFRPLWMSLPPQMSYGIVGITVGCALVLAVRKSDEWNF